MIFTAIQMIVKNAEQQHKSNTESNKEQKERKTYT